MELRGEITRFSALHSRTESKCEVRLRRCGLGKCARSRRSTRENDGETERKKVGAAALSLLSEEQKETRNGKRGESARGRDRWDGWMDGRRWEKLKGTSSAVEREDDHVQVVGWNNVEREGMRDGEEGRKDGDK